MRYWYHKKYLKHAYVGVYVDAAGDRALQLRRGSVGKKHVVTFESWQQAKKLGWVLR